MHRQLAVVLIGAPGCGKGTQRKKLTPLGFDELEMSALIREVMNSGVYPEYKKKMDRGDLLDDSDVNKILELRLGEVDRTRDLVLDGVARTEKQAEFVIDHLLLLGREVHFIIFELEDEICFERLANRNEGRADDDPKIHRKRLSIYYNQLARVVHVIGYSRVATHFIQANRSVEEIHADIADKFSISVL